MEPDVSMLPDNIRTEDMDWAARSYCQALKGSAVTCRGCREDFPLLMLYRCYHCGSYFCPKCARDHFSPCLNIRRDEDDQQ